jgi:hypothetical protein
LIFSKPCPVRYKKASEIEGCPEIRLWTLEYQTSLFEMVTGGSENSDHLNARHPNTTTIQKRDIIVSGYQMAINHPISSQVFEWSAILLFTIQNSDWFLNGPST